MYCSCCCVACCCGSVSVAGLKWEDVRRECGWRARREGNNYTRKSRTRGGQGQVNVVDGVQANGRHGALCLYGVERGVVGVIELMGV